MDDAELCLQRTHNMQKNAKDISDVMHSQRYLVHSFNHNVAPQFLSPLILYSDFLQSIL